MAKSVFKNAFLSINGVDLSDHVEQVELTHEAALEPATSMGDNTRVRIGSIKDWSINVTFRQDFAAGKVDATLNGLLGTTFAVALRADAGAKSATNPEYGGTGILESYAPIGGSVGDIASAPVSIRAAGDLARTTA